MAVSYPPFYDETPFGIYQKVLAGHVSFPSFVDAKAKDLIKKLLHADTTKRYGTLHSNEDLGVVSSSDASTSPYVYHQHQHQCGEMYSI